MPLLSLMFEPGHSVFLTRNRIVETFPLYLLLARSLVLSKRLMFASILAALITLNGVAYLSNTIPERKEDYRAAVKIVANHAAACNLVVFVPPYIEYPFAYYYYRGGSTGVQLDALGDGVIAEVKDEAFASLPVALGNSQRVWLITNSDNIYRQDTLGTVADVEAQGRLLNTWYVQQMAVQLFEVKKTI